jgi:NitT/TauT family transport system substrate-binding protein
MVCRSCRRFLNELKKELKALITRRALVKRALAAAGAGLVLGHARGGLAAEPPPETTRIRLSRYPVDIVCVAAEWVAEELLRAEGFETVEYVLIEGDNLDLLANGGIDVTFNAAPGLVLAVAEGKPLVGLGGMHGGCYELFGSTRVRSVADLRGRTVAVADADRHVFVAAMVSFVGLDPRKDVKIVLTSDATQQFIEGKVDAALGFPPEPQEFRARKIGRVIVNTSTDRPWSQYFCCFAAGNRNFVRKHPVATKRALRALVKAVDICAAEPDRVVRGLIDRGFLKNYDYSLQALREIPYRRWREYDSADTIRFFALRMHEAGMIKSSPQKIIAEGMDWRFVNELKKELKG